MAQNLTAFLAKNAKKVGTKKYVASDRFTGEDGKPVEWEIGCITAGENAKLRNACISNIPMGRGQYTQSFDSGKYSAKVIARCVVYPDLNNAELQDSWGVKSAEDLAFTMLTSGEFEDLTNEVLKFNGFEDDRTKVEDAKN